MCPIEATFYFFFMSPQQQQLAHALFCGIEATDVSAVEGALIEIEKQVLGPAPKSGFQSQIFADVIHLFQEGFAGRQAIDTPYHNLEHTLQTTLCFAQICLNWKLTDEQPPIDPDQFQNGLVAALLHDVGYMKDAHDTDGSGAKHTHGHELRSCDIATAYLTDLDWDPARIRTICSVICCTGPHADFSSIEFENDKARILGQIVCTADYLGQIADPGYVEKIPALFRELEESDQVRNIPPENRNYASLNELFQGTDSFWNTFVEPRLKDECGNVYLLLADPETGTNTYLAQVQTNLKQIQELNSSAAN